MQNYKNLSGTSGVLRYQIGADNIIVEFELGNEKFYRYNYEVTGVANVNHMKVLAEAGQGLNTFINAEVKSSYESKW